MRRPVRVALLVAWSRLAAVSASAEADPYADWGPPYRVIYGGYSMQPEDWDLWKGTFNIVHHSLLGRDKAETRALLDKARQCRIKLLTTAPVWNRKTRVLDVEPLRRLLEAVEPGDPALFGYVVEAACYIPKAMQKKIYDAIKKLDPVRPVWMEFSSTSGERWKDFNRAACDALFTYNYPYEVGDREGYDPAQRRIGYTVRAIQGVRADRLPVIPILQAFRGKSGGDWRVPPPGAMADQFDAWLALRKVQGVAFYRWRGGPPFYGLLADGTPGNYTWSETQELCRQVAGQDGPFVDAAAWRRTAAAPVFEPTAILLDEDWEEVPVGTVLVGSAPAGGWQAQNVTVVGDETTGSSRVAHVEGELGFDLDPPTDRGDAVRITFEIEPLEQGYARGLVFLTSAPGDSTAVGVRLGGGGGSLPDVFTALQANGAWTSLRVAFTTEHRYRVALVCEPGTGQVFCEIRDATTERLRLATWTRRFSGTGFGGLRIQADRARAVRVDNIRIETGTLRRRARGGETK